MAKSKENQAPNRPRRKRQTNHLTAFLQADCSSELKQAFRDWWLKNNLATEAEALRFLVREAIKSDQKSQANSPVAANLN